MARSSTAYRTRAAVRSDCSEERARELLSPVLKDGYYGITEVRLSTKSFSDVSVTVLADVLKKLPSLTIVDMDDIISGRMDAEALRVIEVRGAIQLRLAYTQSSAVTTLRHKHFI